MVLRFPRQTLCAGESQQRRAGRRWLVHRGLQLSSIFSSAGVKTVYKPSPRVCFCQLLFCQVFFCQLLICQLCFCQLLFCQLLFCQLLFCQLLFCQLCFCQLLFCQLYFCQLLFCQLCFCQLSKMLVFTGVYVCVKAKLTFVSFFLSFFLHLSLTSFIFLGRYT